ncbi:hypothetical protein FACS189413_12180 [Bacteroidia bacterium]|nr:hypothetical protein FACS189413_12180 [Bacteroidia bacterium]
MTENLKSPLISIILPVYNGEKYLREAMDSIVAQTFRLWELIVINNASTDSSREIVLQYNDSRIILLDNETNQGLIYSLNKGLAHCRGKYISRIDADDIALPEKLQTQYDFMETHPETGVCGCSMEAFNDEKHYSQRVDFATFDQAIRAFAFFQSPFNHPSIILRKSVLDEHQLKYPSLYRNAEDYGFWIEILKYTQGANISQVLTRYRKHENSETAIDDKKTEVKVSIIVQIHTRYLQQNGIDLTPEQMLFYTRFTDRSIPCHLNRKNQKEIEKVLKDFLSQLKQKQAALYPGVLHYLSVNTFVKFFNTRKFPHSLFLLKLYAGGAWYYIRRFLPSVPCQ